MQSDTSNLVDSGATTSLIVSNSVSILSTLTSTPAYLTDSTVQSSLSIGAAVLAQTSTFSTLTKSNPLFNSAYTSILGNILTYSSTKLASLGSRRRNLQDASSSSSIAGIQSLND